MTESAYGDRLYPTTKLEPLIGLQQSLGLSPARVLAAAGLGEAEVASPATRVSIDQVLAAYQAFVEETADPLLAYRLGRAFHTTTYGTYGFAMLSSADLGKALAVAVEYHRLSTPLVTIRLDVEGPSAVWRVEPIPHPSLFGPLYEFVTRLHLGISLALHHELTGGVLASMDLGLAFDASPGETDGLGEIGAVQVERARGASFIRFDEALLRQPTQMGSAAVNRMLLQICDEQIQTLRKREGLAGQVRTLLITNGFRILGLDAAADRLGVTERSLRRRLAAEGTSFRAVHDEVQLQAAIAYLRDTTLTVEAIAEAMGYSEAANFRRAFRRWTGLAPLQYRGRGV
jgi:AraC-like DNA-binding protein